MPSVVLHRGRDRSVRRRHPWLLASAVARVEGLEGEPPPGALVQVVSAEGEVLGHGHLSPGSKLRVRLVAFGKEPPPDGWLEQHEREDSQAHRRRYLPEYPRGTA